MLEQLHGYNNTTHLDRAAPWAHLIIEQLHGYNNTTHLEQLHGYNNTTHLAGPTS